jgi:hypothetical protein
MDAIEFACVMGDITNRFKINMDRELVAKIFEIYVKKAPVYNQYVDDYEIYYTELEEYEKYIDTYDDIYTSYDDEDFDNYEIDNDEIAYIVSKKIAKQLGKQ